MAYYTKTCFKLHSGCNLSYSLSYTVRDILHKVVHEVADALQKSYMEVMKVTQVLQIKEYFEKN